MITQHNSLRMSPWISQIATQLQKDATATATATAAHVFFGFNVCLLHSGHKRCATTIDRKLDVD